MLAPGELGPPPTLPERPARAAQIVVVARGVLEDQGPEALTMRRLAGELGIQAPSLYKHFASKRAVEAAVITDALVEMGEVTHRALHSSGRQGPLRALLAAYRRHALAHPNLYRLATAGPLPRDLVDPEVEEWAGNPWYVVTGDAFLAQALWSFAHGMVILELDRRFSEGSDLGRTWKVGAAAFAGSARPL